VRVCRPNLAFVGRLKPARLKHLFRANLELAGRFSSLIKRFEDFGGILKVKPLWPGDSRIPEANSNQTALTEVHGDLSRLEDVLFREADCQDAVLHIRGD